MVNIRYKALSYVGRRSNNQDNVIAAQYNDRLWFFAVADGMGGAKGGDKASEIVVETAAKFLNQWSKIEDIDPDSLKEILSQIYVEGQKNINEFVENNPDLKGMGTTFTTLLVYDDKYVFGNIGDSRLYRLSEQMIEAITEDHSAVKEYEKKYGKDVPDDIVQKYGHILTRTMDGGEDKPDIYPLDEDYEQIKEGQLFLICSDGLILEKSPDNAEYNDILNHYISATDSLKQAAENLVSFAYNKGSSDNISVVLAEFGEYKRLETDYQNLDFPPEDNTEPNENKGSVDPTILHEASSKETQINKGKKRRNVIKTMITLLSFILVFLLLLATNVISVNWKAFDFMEKTKDNTSADPPKSGTNKNSEINLLQDIEDKRTTNSDIIDKKGNKADTIKQKSEQENQKSNNKDDKAGKEENNR
ncbi:MAG: PP2C family protein-serine/threonine phosphatase [archaeon]